MSDERASDERELYRRAEDVVATAMELPAGERPAVITAACAGDPSLRARVEALMAALGRAERFLSDPTSDGLPGAGPTAAVTEGPGSRIGRYKLLEQIGEGGFGVVFMAEQEVPVRRQVALKVIKLGMDTREVVARFEAERQALALMDHPSIARVFDAGSTDAGRPYFVMELVRGSPITEYADRHKLSTGDRVSLAAAVCRAVQHAHGKGVIHRDLKPTNVLVTVTDGRPVPKVIDFGIAKATEARLTDRTLFTGHRQLIGTPQYMSPEQADSDGSDIDTRTDVYSLGVVLYELLVGATPIDGRELRSAAAEAMRRMIRERDPASPSTRLSSLGETLATVATNRGTDAKHLSRQLSGELDWIVMRALEKDRTRRYDTAAALADDLGRYLAGEAVLAGPVSGAYRARTWARRHRAAIGVAGAVAAALLLGIVGTTIGLVRANRLRHVAEQRQVEADRSRKLAESESDRAQAEVQFLADVLERATPAYMPDKAVRDVVVRDMIEPVVAGIEDRFAGQPLAEMQIRYQMGELYEALGRIDLALPLLKAAAEGAAAETGPDSAETLNGRAEYAHALQIANRPAEAEPVQRSALADLRRVFGPDDARTVRAGLGLAMVLGDLERLPEAVPLVRQGYDASVRTLGPDAAGTLDAADLLADFLRRAGDNAASEAVAADAYARARRTLGEDAQVTRSSASLRGQALVILPGYAEAEPVLARVREQNHRILGDDHPYSIRTATFHGSALVLVGRAGEGAALLRDTWDRSRRVSGDAHPATLAAARAYAASLGALGRWAEAEPIARSSAEQCRRTLGDGVEATIQSDVIEAQALHGLGRDGEAEPLARSAVERVRRLRGDGYPLTWWALWVDAAVLHGLGRDADALPLAEQAWAGTRAVAGDAHPYTARRRQTYADVLRSLGRGAEAAALPATGPATRPPPAGTPGRESGARAARPGSRPNPS